MYSILYVDDEDVLLKLNKLYLERGGDFSVDIAPSAGEGLEKLRQTPYDAVLSDYQMPGMDGIEFLKEVRRLHGRLPFLLFTGKGREEIVIEALNNGADFYIQKGPDLKGMIAELRHKLVSAIESRRTEDALRKSRQQLTDIIDFLPDPTFVISVDGRVIAWNRAIENLTGTLKADIVGKGDYEYSLPFIGNRGPILIDAIIQGPYLKEMPYPNLQNEDNKITSDFFCPRLFGGKGAYLLASAGPLYGPDGNLVGAIETLRDITDFHNVKRDLVLTQEKNRGLLDLLPVAVVETDKASRVTYANRRAVELFGNLPPADSGMIPSIDFLRPAQKDQLLVDLEGILEGRTCTGREYPLTRLDGSEFPALIYGDRILDPSSGELLGCRGIIADISRQKEDALALRESEERLRLAIEAGYLGVWDVDMSRKQIHDISRWFNEALGYGFADSVLPVTACSALIHPEDMPTMKQAFQDYLLGRRSLFECGFRIKCPDGAWRMAFVRGQVIDRSSDGKPLRITGIVHTGDSACRPGL